ncbi:uncharacterized protein B0P05DRAFT_562997 [Gilbertella persicaria]|uniref:uncharacterized protein n=1 Tax=Gilbertella persicaria TaxID=101096 RepID=UPI0022207D01|nr:uncharacterized protein B0P05DRAFT_562997 [Gilbertella persicaria]KAI8050643.1 hypothetical protein B0P05DRAFT_562997 [Gilbertella persicaria]
MHLLWINRNTLKINPNIKPDPYDLSNYCCSCDYTYKSVITFHARLKKRHRIRWRCFLSKNKTSS